MNLCACGCGQRTKIVTMNCASRGLVKGESRKFIHGHNGIGGNNGRWKLNGVSYWGGHNRVYAARGKATKCEVCGMKGKKKYEWASLTGNYSDPNDYKQMCVSCHHKHDISAEKQREISRIGNKAAARFWEKWRSNGRPSLWRNRGRNEEDVRHFVEAIAENRPQEGPKTQ